ncbi:MAG: beta-propeller fold lactonase family protein [Chloroflexi bacterium]|nr:beta-propeller fold lactonase family protein [Chloroflexota bacterium]
MHALARTRSLLAYVAVVVVSAALGLACSAGSGPPRQFQPSSLAPPLASPVSQETPTVASARATPVAGAAQVVTANLQGRSLSIVNAETLRLQDTIDSGTSVRGVAITPDGRHAWLTAVNAGGSSVVVVDLAARQRAAEVTVGAQPWSIVMHPSAAIAFVSNGGSATVSVVDTTRRVEAATVKVGREPRGLAFTSRRGGVLYVANYADNSVSVVDTMASQLVVSVPVGQGPVAVAVSPDGEMVYVANAGSQSVSVIDATRNVVTETLKLNGSPAGLAASPDGGQVYVAVQATAPGGTGHVVVIDAARDQIAGHVVTGGAPTAVVFNADGTRAFVTNAAANSVAVVDVGMRNVIGTIEVGLGPTAVVFARTATPPAPVANLPVSPTPP